MKNLKIFVDCHVFDGSPQGTASYIKGLYQELIKDQNKTFYFASYTGNLESIFGNNNNVHYLQYSSKSKYLRLLVDIPGLIKKNNIDYAHFQYIVPPVKKCKYIVTIHDVLFLDFPRYFPFAYKISKKILFKWSAKKADIVLTVSEYSKSRIQDHFKIENIEVTPNAIEAVFFEEFDKKAVTEANKVNYGLTNYFLYVSRWEKRKNHLLLLKVFVENKFYDQFHLVFVGDNSITNTTYKSYFKTLPNKIKDKIVILNKVNFDELLNLIRGASLSIYPSIAEGFGIPPLETAAAHIPTICSNTTAMSDFDFFQNSLFDPFDEKDLKYKIIAGLNPQNLSAISKAIKDKYNWRIAASVLVKAINDNQNHSI
ncbi:glycosyltransferase involved in cell wall biosynthesis [Flavobacterium sp. CG_9.10]|uniref:glycosyltransferase family 4 protein n=1 Tax=Flavobacterium sp. CG_9.10 TaxID=2787729 RepID=UPI0018CAE03E|nr:glycosyltransferase family 1 protein [Flavobacterium sp. CG_9.10]MBG6111767.1 glycosyltransferase involved in cell wall biosynthesis [Flavobacterium sp. CG_9.10]